MVIICPNCTSPELLQIYAYPSIKQGNSAPIKSHLPPLPPYLLAFAYSVLTCFTMHGKTNWLCSFLFRKQIISLACLIRVPETFLTQHATTQLVRQGRDPAKVSRKSFRKLMAGRLLVLREPRREFMCVFSLQKMTWTCNSRQDYAIHLSEFDWSTNKQFAYVSTCTRDPIAQQRDEAPRGMPSTAKGQITECHD